MINKRLVYLGTGEPSGITTWAALQEAINATDGNATTPATETTTIRLTQDLTASGSDSSITIPAGKDITLDLAGCVLNANGGAFSVITVAEGGKLTVIDSVSTTEHAGYVDENGLWHWDASGAYQVQTGETAKNIKGGIITGGNTSFGGGVFVNCGTFTMSGGNIAGCQCDDCGGGVYAYYGTIKMTGGSITGCPAYDRGGGVFNSNTITLGGTAKITGNMGVTAKENLYLPSNKFITLGTGDNSPKTGMSVGVTTSTEPTADAPVAISTNGTADDAKYFTSDVEGVEV